MAANRAHCPWTDPNLHAQPEWAGDSQVRTLRAARFLGRVNREGREESFGGDGAIGARHESCAMKAVPAAPGWALEVGMGQSTRLLLTSRAQSMRFAPTATEAALWAVLKGSRLGVGFRRQVEVGRYIVDYYAPSIRLVVEVDGGWHVGRTRADERRDRDLVRWGYRVVRVPAEMVKHRLDEAVRLVVAAVHGR